MFFLSFMFVWLLGSLLVMPNQIMARPVDIVKESIHRALRDYIYKEVIKDENAVVCAHLGYRLRFGGMR